MGRSLVLVVNSDGTIRQAEGSLLADLGVSDEPILGRLAVDVFHDRPALVRCVRTSLEGRPERMQLELESVSVVLQSEPRSSAGRADGALIVGVVAMLPMFLRQIPGLLWATDRDLRITWALGRLPKDLARDVIGMTVPEFLATDDPNDPAILRHRIALDGEPQSFTYPFRDRWFFVNVEAFRDKVGVSSGCVGTAVDVTERRRATAQLESTVSLLQATLEASADGLLVIDSDGRVVTYNQRFGQMWNLPEAILERRDDAELLRLVREQLEQPDDFVRRVGEFYADPEREGSDVLHFKDGRVYERYSRPQRVGDQIVGRVWSFRDVSERERILTRTTFLAEATRLLASLDVERALDALVLMAVPHVGESCTVELFDGATSRSFFAASRLDVPPVQGDFPRAVIDGHPTLFGQDGHSRMAVPLLAKGKPVGAISFIASSNRRYSQADLAFAQQIAERAALSLENGRLYRDARDALLARDQFLSIVAHEIRSPLTSIHLSAQTLRRKAVKQEDLSKALEIVEREDRRLGRFVDELLDVGRIQSGRFQFEFEEVDLAEVGHSVVAQIADEIVRAGTPVSVNADENVLGEWDRFRLEQVVLNLVTNAIKFGVGKPVDVTVRAADGFGVLRVHDHGIGIPPEMHEKIFLPFERAVSTRHFGGLGLGLYIVRTIVEGLGGSITVESRPNEGSTFVVKLPRTRKS